MKLTLRELRRIIREAGLDSDMRNMAGTAGGEGAHGNFTDKAASLVNGPPGLGGPEDQEEDTFTDDEQQQQKNQFAVRVADRRAR